MVILNCNSDESLTILNITFICYVCGKYAICSFNLRLYYDLLNKKNLKFDFQMVGHKTISSEAFPI